MDAGKLVRNQRNPPVFQSTLEFRIPKYRNQSPGWEEPVMWLEGFDAVYPERNTYFRIDASLAVTEFTANTNCTMFEEGINRILHYYIYIYICSHMFYIYATVWVFFFSCDETTEGAS